MTKKILCLALVALMILACGISAMANTATTDINDNLVAYWNFEGTTEFETLRDKAEKGTSIDNLEKVGSDVTITDGVAAVPSAPGNWLQATTGNADLIGLESMTIYMKVKYQGTNSDFADLMSYQGLYRIYKLKDATSPLGAVIEASAFATKNDSALGGAAVRTRPQSGAAVGLQQDEWFYVALSMEITAEKNGVATIYVSKDGMTYNKAQTQMTFSDPLLENLETRKAVPTEVTKDNSVTFGKTSIDTAIADRGISYWYDDVRIYNTVLDEMDLARIIPNSLDLRNEADITTVATTTAATTTAAATTKAATTKAATTAAATTAAATTAAATTVVEDEEGGCGSVIAVPAFALIAGICATGCVVRRKKK